MTTVLRESVSVWSGSSPAVVANKPGTESHRTKLVLVDDDDDYREVVGSELQELGFDVVALADGPALFEFFSAGQNADVVVLDWRLPAGPGIELLPQLRRQGVMVPVMFLTGMSAAAYESAALDRGALDFVDKARGVPILAKRIRLIVEAGKRPPQLSREEAICSGPLTLKPRVSRAYWYGLDVDLTVTEFNIVHLLVSQAGEHVTYRAIYDCVHRIGFIAGSGEDGYRTNVRSSVKRIRNKFRVIDAQFSEIENFPAFGYRWRSAPTRSA